MNAKLITLLVASAAILGGVAGGNILAYQQQHAADAKILAFDYEHCRAIVAVGDLDKNPGVPVDWHEMKKTPGGNWCIS